MSSLRRLGLDGREAAIAAAIGGGVFVIVGYGTGLGITASALPTMTIAKPAVPGGSAPTTPSMSMPPNVALGAIQAAPVSAPILTAPVRIFRTPALTVPSAPSPSRSDQRSTAACPAPSSETPTGGLLALDLSGVAAPVLQLLDGLPVVGSLLGGTSPTTGPTASSCPSAVPCCMVGGRAVRR